MVKEKLNKNVISLKRKLKVASKEQRSNNTGFSNALADLFDRDVKHLEKRYKV
jgi:hypothetical protein